MNLKLYHFDGGWGGSIVIVAESKEQAFNIAREQNPYCADAITSPEKFVEHEISHSLSINGGGAY